MSELVPLVVCLTVSGIQLVWEGDLFLEIFGAQWSPSNMDNIGTITLCPEYGGVHISEAPGMLRWAWQWVLVLLSTMTLPSRALPCCTLVRRANQSVCHQYTIIVSSY